MKLIYLFLFLTFNFSFLNAIDGNNLKILAENFFKGIYGHTDTIEWDIVDVSVIFQYPDFTKLNNKEVLHGFEEISKFSDDFCSKWIKIEITFHNSVESENDVKLIWNFKARFVGEDQNMGSTYNSIQNWSGITFFKFNDSGKIISVKGEESDDGSL